MTSISFTIRGDFDEFEDEPEDELASRGMHVVESDEEEEKPEEAEEVLELEEEAEEDAEEDKDAEAKEAEYKDGLEELADMERTYVESTAPSFGAHEEDEA